MRVVGGCAALQLHAGARGRVPVDRPVPVWKRALNKCPPCRFARPLHRSFARLRLNRPLTPRFFSPPPQGMPYFYFVFLVVLLSDRARRDDRRCKSKYGVYWDEYCKRVPYKMIPLVY